jgi:hypothetical protein
MTDRPLSDKQISGFLRLSGLEQCPTPEELSRLATGEAGTVRSAALRSHLERCPACRETAGDLERLFQARPMVPTRALKERLRRIFLPEAGADLLVSLVAGKLKIVKSLLRPLPRTLPAYRGLEPALTQGFLVARKRRSWELLLRPSGRGRVDLMLRAKRAPVTPATVTLMSGERELASQTRPGGLYRFTGIAPGEYRLVWDGDRTRAVKIVIGGK